MNQSRARNLLSIQSIGCSLSILLGVRSQRNSFARQLVGLYLYTSGAQRQVFNVLSHLGISCSYPTIVGQGTLKQKTHRSESETPQVPNLPKPLPGPISDAKAQSPMGDSMPEVELEKNMREDVIGDLEDDDDYDDGIDWSAVTRQLGDAVDVAHINLELPGDSQRESTQTGVALADEVVDSRVITESHEEPDPIVGEAPTSSSANEEMLSRECTNASQDPSTCLTANRSVNVPRLPPNEHDVNVSFPQPIEVNVDGPSKTSVPSQSAMEGGVSQSEDQERSQDEQPPKEPTSELAPMPTRRDGLLFMLSYACRHETRRLALTKIMSYVYDNINMVFKSAEPILGRKDSQENGTCATAFPLYNATLEKLLTSELLDSFNKAPPLVEADILLTPKEHAELTAHLNHTVLRIIIQVGGDRFKHFLPQLQEMLPKTSHRIPIHQTLIRPLPSMNIDESSIVGNAEVLDTIFKEADPTYKSPAFMETLKIVWGDQLSTARVRSIVKTRAGQESPHSAFLNCVCAPGLFHYQISAAGSVLETHWGDPEQGNANPASLSSHNILLDRKPITITSPPPYRTCRDLIFVSLYGRIFHCLQLVSDFENIDNFAAKVSFEQLEGYAASLVSIYATPFEADTYCDARHDEILEYKHSNPDDEDLKNFRHTKGDMVYENGIYFLRDALLLREFTDAIKAGDSGRVVLVLKMYALSYRGSGRPKYAYETLHLIHNLTHVWPVSLRCVV